MEWVMANAQWIMAYAAKWDKLSTPEYAMIAMFLLIMIVVTIVLWKLYRSMEAYLYRRYQLFGWQENRGKTVTPQLDEPLI